MFDLIARVLSFYYDLWPSYGMAIVLLTLTVMVVVLPLTLKATRSMLLMQSLQPEIKKLQAEHRDDRQRLNEEMMKLYRENKINPLSGCLPLLIQFPVFIVLYSVLRGLTGNRDEDGTFAPGHLDPDSALYKALDSSTEMVSWGMDLANSATNVVRDSGILTALPYILLVLGVALTTYVQQKQISARNPNAEVNPQQRMLLRIMPAFMAFISIGLPAALVVYFFVSNLFRVGQQALISHTIYRPAVREGLIHKPDKSADGKKGAIDTKATEKPATDKPAGGTGKASGAGKSSGVAKKTGGAAKATGAAKKASGTTAKKAPAGTAKTPAPTKRTTPPVHKPPKSTPAPAASDAEPPRGIFGRLFGGAAAPTNGDGAGRTKTGSDRPSGGSGGQGPKPTSGRVTPRGSRSSGAAGRKRKRK
jgi:YidC/Oxa1 family membrane protein insertase